MSKVDELTFGVSIKQCKDCEYKNRDLRNVKDFSESDYYWAKAEFQDDLEHRRHVENFKQGKPDCDYFYEQYKFEALNELYGEYRREWCKLRGYDLTDVNEETGIHGECYACFNEWYNNEYKENGGRL